MTAWAMTWLLNMCIAFLLRSNFQILFLFVQNTPGILYHLFQPFVGK